MVVDRSGIHRAHKLDATSTTTMESFASISTGPLWSLPEPIDGFWRVMKDRLERDGCFAICISSTSARAKYS